MTTPHDPKRKLGVLTLATLGIVYGDIGTSPLYAFKEAFTGSAGLDPNQDNIFAALSALFWAIMLIISAKYVWLVLRFDNKGEGGVLALQALASRHSRRAMPQWSKTVAIVGVFAAALFYGDAMITPAISVLSAVEGIGVVTPQFEHLVVPITLGIIVALFLIQRYGTTRVGQLFGPVTVVWFLTLGILGVRSIAQSPEVIAAINPMYAIEFCLQQPGKFFVLLSAVFLALTGGEAMYADMGHFGAKPIRIAWYGLVCPALVLNYFGQGALVLRNVAAVETPFYLLAPTELLVPLVILATLATIIASQATISGAYSLTLQATRLGYLPHIRVQYTSDTEQGQIYVPSVNWLMLIGVILLVLGFGSSAGLAAAYGIAVSGTMIITTVLILVVAVARPNQRLRVVIIPAAIVFLFLECLFFGANLVKIEHGGWIPMLLGLYIFVVLTTWKKGSELLADQRRKLNSTIHKFATTVYPGVQSVPGTGIYLTSNPNLVPSRLIYNIKHYKVMHEQLIFLHVDTEDIPYVREQERLTVVGYIKGIYGVAVRFGFREEPNLSKALLSIDRYGIDFNIDDATFFVARTTVVNCDGVMPHWRCALFGWMMRQSESAASYFNLPSDRVVEIGTQVILQVVDTMPVDAVP